MSQGESQLSHIIHAAERWASQTNEHSVEEHAGQITYLRELVQNAMGEQGNSLPMHLLRSRASCARSPRSNNSLRTWSRRACTKTQSRLPSVRRPPLESSPAALALAGSADRVRPSSPQTNHPCPERLRWPLIWQTSARSS